MPTTHHVSGMTCAACERKLTDSVAKLLEVERVTADASKGTITIEGDPDPSELAAAVARAGDYKLTDKPAPGANPAAQPDARSNLKGYRSLAILILYILAASTLGSIPDVDAQGVMLNFMGGFFLAFSFFKFLDLPGFVSSYRRYDLIAERFPVWAWLYPFLELALGVAYLARYSITVVLIVTLVLMLVSGAGVLRSVLRKDRIKCACLGTVIDLPLGTVTLIEDFGMAAMAAVTLAMMWS